jgi:hypothetical protein
MAQPEQQRHGKSDEQAGSPAEAGDRVVEA